MKALAINSWYRVFEPSLMKDASGTVSLPMKRGTGMCKLAKFPDGASAYGIFISLLPIAIAAVPRGTLVYSDKETKPHDADSLALITGFQPDVIQKAIDLLIDIGWLEWVEFEVNETPKAKKPTPPLSLFLTDLGAKTAHNGTSLMGEWESAVKGMKPSDVQRIFKAAVPGITYPREFLKHRREMGL